MRCELQLPKVIFSLILVCFYPNIVSAQYGLYGDRERIGWVNDNGSLKGEVDCVIINDYELKNVNGKEQKGNFIQKWIYYFNDSGNVDYYEIYSASGMLDSKVVYVYDHCNNNIRNVLYASDKNVIITVETQYNEQNQKISERMYQNDELRNVFTFEYKGSRVIVKETFGVLAGYADTYYLDSEGRVIKEESSEGRRIKMTTTNEYDLNGKIKETITRDSHGNISFVYQYSYDENSSIIKYTSKSGVSVDAVWYYTNDERGSCVQKKEYKTETEFPVKLREYEIKYKPKTTNN